MKCCPSLSKLLRLNTKEYDVTKPTAKSNIPEPPEYVKPVSVPKPKIIPPSVTSQEVTAPQPVASQKVIAPQPVALQTTVAQQETAPQPELEVSTIRPTVEEDSVNGNKTDFGLDTDTETTNKPRTGVRSNGIIYATNQNEQSLTTEKYEKDEESRALIKKAIMANDFLKNLMVDERLDAVVDAMSPQILNKNSYIIKEGETGSHLYVSTEGEFEVFKEGKVVASFGAGVAFGELAILYKAKRFASIRVKTAAKVWVLERRVFRQIMIRTGRQEQEENVRFLSAVDLLKGLHEIEINKIADLAKREFYLTGTAIVRQGEKGDKFYIIRAGSVAVTKQQSDGAPEEDCGQLNRGAYFGEQALLHSEHRLATVTALDPGVECLTLNRIAFNSTLGDLKEIRSIRHSDSKAPDLAVAVNTVAGVNNPEFENIHLSDFKKVGTLGVGGFGRVELVQNEKDKTRTYALKYLKKIDMVQQQQQDHAYNEKDIMVSCKSPFICQLYQTYKDSKYLYFLMEACLGGDVWTILQKQKLFDEKTSRFMTACVVEAFEYMHDRGMIYRDLKPENLMLDSMGFVKLVDFGFAKKVAVGTKTWTFAGTPEYVAPEIILNKGHDRAVDYWALGIFIHELLVGKPPFRGADNMKTYHLILRGIDAVVFPPKVSKKAQTLIKKLCRPVATDRLGYQKNGIKDIKDSQWFSGMDWEKLRNRNMSAPLVLPVTSNTDLSHFANYPKDKDVPPDETSGWDKNF